MRENTQSLYVEAQTEEQVRRYLKDRNFNIEFITKLEGTFRLRKRKLRTL